MQPARPPRDVSALKSQFRRGVAMAALGLSQAGGAGLSLLGIGLSRVGGIVLALVLLFEQWGWKPLAAALAAIAHLAPIAALERIISRLPPYGALLVFGLPVVLLLPIKLLALYLIARGHVFSAGLLFVAAKVVGTAIVARLYHLTEPQLMTIGWVRHVRDVVMPRLHALHEEIRLSWAWRYGRVLKGQARQALRPVLAGLRARLAALFPGRRGPL